MTGEQWLQLAGLLLGGSGLVAAVANYILSRARTQDAARLAAEDWLQNQGKKRFEELEARLAEVTKERDEQEKRIAALEREKDAANRESRRLLNQLDTLLRRINLLEGDNQQIRRELDKEREGSAKLRTQVTAISNELSSAQIELEVTQGALKRRTQELNESNALVLQLQEQLQAIRGRLVAVEKKTGMLSDGKENHDLP